MNQNQTAAARGESFSVASAAPPEFPTARQRVRLFAAVLVTTLFFAPCLSTIFAASTKKNTKPRSSCIVWLKPSATPLRPPFAAGEKLYFEFGWNNIPAAYGSISAEKTIYASKPAWRLSLECATNSVVDVFWKMRSKGFSVVSFSPFLPHTHFLDRRENKRHRRTSIFYDHRAHLLRCLIQKPEKHKSDVYTIKSNDSLDPITMAYFLRCFDYQIGKTYAISMIFSKKTYRFEMAARRREKLKTPAGKFKAMVFDLSVTRTDEKSGEKLAKLRRARLWVSDDKRKLPLRLDSEVFIGRVYGELTKIENPNGATTDE